MPSSLTGEPSTATQLPCHAEKRSISAAWQRRLESTEILRLRAQNDAVVWSVRSGAQRQGDGEGAALAGLRLHPDAATVGLDQNAADVETEPETRRSGVRPVEP